LNVVVLDSVAPTMNLLTNAFGRVSPRQLAALEKLGPLLSREKKPVIVCLHHHLRAPTDLPIGGKRLQHLFMCVAAPNAVLAAIARAFGRVPVFHGHRHIARRQDVRGVEIIGAASTTLGGFRRSRHGGVEPVGPGYVHWRNNGDAGLEDRFISLGRITLPVEVE
jgi:3',5'-cyclic AMP phosphodiesterase CpdA